MTEFTFQNGNVEMAPAGFVDGEQASAYRLQDESTIHINGSDQQDTFLFKDVSPFTGEALAMSMIDGKGGNDIVDLANFDKEDVTFEIGREGVPIKVLETDNRHVIFPGIHNLGDVGMLRGGPRGNAFEFFDGWNQDLFIESPGRAGKLDFTGFNYDLQTTVDSEGKLTVTAMGQTVNATGIQEIHVANGNTTSVDLSGIDEAMEIKVEKIDPNRDDANGLNTKVTIRGLANNSELKSIVIYQIKGLKAWLP